MNKQRILFVGGGNMTQAIVAGLIADGCLPEKITVFDRHLEKREFFSSQYNVEVTEALTPNLFDAAIIVLSVKPQNAKAMCLQLEPLLQNKKILILSVMTGLTINTLNTWLGNTLPIVRAMPNTPALVKAGATGLFAGSVVSQEQKQQVESLISCIGIVAWLKQETQIDAITALSGSGPAYFFLMIEAMQAAAIQLGLPEEISKQFAVQTAYGAAMLALNSEEDISTLRARVTSKGGTTEAALNVFQKKGLVEIVEEAMRAARDKSRELGG